MKYLNMKHKAFVSMCQCIADGLANSSAKTTMVDLYPGHTTYSACSVHRNRIKSDFTLKPGLSEVKQRHVAFLAGLGIHSQDEAIKWLNDYVSHPRKGTLPPRLPDAGKVDVMRVASAFGIPVIQTGKGMYSFHWGYSNDALSNAQAEVVERCASLVAAEPLFTTAACGQTRGS